MKDSSLISVVVPLFNETDSVSTLHQELLFMLQKYGKSFEIIFVDDGSTDNTFEVIKNLKPLRVIRLRRNYGQTTALGVGIRESSGDVIVTLDGDLENRPEDIPKLLAKLDEGFDIVSGWRRDRWKNKFLTRRFPSQLANRLVSFVTGVRLHDHGCMLKVYRRQFVEKINFIGDTHRMIAAYASKEGARVVEVPVQFEPRKFGKSKYGISRTFKVLLDVLAFHFFYKYSRRPIHFFGAVGFISFFCAFITAGWAIFLKLFQNTNFIRTPLPILTAIFSVVGVQFILMGLLAEIIARTSASIVDYEEI